MGLLGSSGGKGWGTGGWDFKSTMAGRKPVKLSGKWGGEFRRDDLVTSTVLWQVLVRLQVKDGCSVATDGTTGQRVNSQPLCVPKEKGVVGTQKP